MTRLEGSASVVTGAGGLLGAAFCRALAKQGASVLVNDIDAERAAAVVASIVDAGGTASVCVESADSWENGARIVDTCVERYGRIDCLVNSAHVTVAKPLTELTEADFRATWDSHVIGHFACTRRAAIHMTERGGSIVNLVSRAMAGLKGYSAYSAAKGAILSATFSWALELAPHGIRVNAISPAARHREPGEPVNLRMPWRRQPGQSVDEMRAETPPPESVAPLVVYLASDASDWVSGQIIFLAGDSLALVRHPLEDRFAFRAEGWDVDSLERHFRDSFATAVEQPSMVAGAYRWFDGVE
jgi:3-oxoacyl-[acyl-carrier protein] reductase